LRSRAPGVDSPYIGGMTKPGPDEAADFALMRELIFDNPEYTLEAPPKFERLAGKTPDFRVKRGASLAGFVEVKSPRDDWLDDQFAEAEAMPAEERPEIVGGERPDPIFNRLGRLVKKAAKQFVAVADEGEVPRILVVINHDELTRFEDLRVTFRGFEISANGWKIDTFPGAAEGVRKAAAAHIDLVVFIDAKRGAVIGMMENELHTELVARARNIVGTMTASG
jgi:hypothetical protein